jgi:hypothetical protein
MHLHFPAPGSEATLLLQNGDDFDCVTLIKVFISVDFPANLETATATAVT